MECFGCPFRLKKVFINPQNIFFFKAGPSRQGGSRSLPTRHSTPFNVPGDFEPDVSEVKFYSFDVFKRLCCVRIKKNAKERFYLIMYVKKNNVILFQAFKQI